jgi:hypothetical protein
VGERGEVAMFDFGFNGVFELNDELVNRLLAARLYEKNLVSIGGQVSDADFLPPIDINLGGGTTIRVYLLTGRPEVTFRGRDGTNTVSLFIPMFGIGVFERTNTSVQRRNLNLMDARLGLVIDNVRVAQTAGNIDVDLTGVTAADIRIRGFIFEEPSTHVGGIAVLGQDLSDNDVDSRLSAAGVAVKALDLRTQIAARISAGALGQTTFPFQPSGLDPELSSWDLFTFEENPPASAGAMLELYGPGAMGQGFRIDAVDIIPAAPTTPRYRWAAGIQANVLEAIFDRYLDRSMFPKQGGTLNTPQNPTGYMVVPPSDKRTYSLPDHIESITVSAPSNASVEVRINRGLTPHGRARLDSLNSNKSVSIWADDTGSATATIAAASGHRLALTVEAISLSGDTSVVVWRPRFTFQDGALRLDFHFYKYLDHSCMDAEGDGSIVVELQADRAARFKLAMRVRESDFEIPLWVWAAGFFGGFILGSVGATLAEVGIHVFLKDYVRDEVDPQGKVDNLLGPLNQNLPAPQAPGTAVFLDDFAVSEDGILLAGRAETGWIVSYGRRGTWATRPSLEIGDRGFYLRIDWQPSAGPITVQLSGFSTLSLSNANGFWSETYDDIPPPPYPPTPARKELSPGESAVFYHDSEGVLAKVLVERQPVSDVDPYGLPILVTWVAYQKRVAQSVRIRNEVNAIVVDSFESLTLTTTSYRYSGALTLERTKFFLTEDTMAAGDEHWFWDDEEVPAGELALPGGMVKIDPVAHALLIEYDQTQLPPDEVGGGFHWVRFTGTDVFGRTQSHKYLLLTPAHALTPNKIAELPPVGWRDPRAPLRDPIRDRVAAARSLLAVAVANNPAMAPTARTIMAALSNRYPTLDANGAQALLDMIGNTLRHS